MYSVRPSGPPKARFVIRSSYTGILPRSLPSGVMMYTAGGTSAVHNVGEIDVAAGIHGGSLGEGNRRCRLHSGIGDTRRHQDVLIGVHERTILSKEDRFAI